MALYGILIKSHSRKQSLHVYNSVVAFVACGRNSTSLEKCTLPIRSRGFKIDTNIPLWPSPAYKLFESTASQDALYVVLQDDLSVQYLTISMQWKLFLKGTHVWASADDNTTMRTL